MLVSFIWLNVCVCFFLSFFIYLRNIFFLCSMYFLFNLKKNKQQLLNGENFVLQCNLIQLGLCLPSFQSTNHWLSVWTIGEIWSNIKWIFHERIIYINDFMYIWNEIYCITSWKEDKPYSLSNWFNWQHLHISGFYFIIPYKQFDIKTLSDNIKN